MSNDVRVSDVISPKRDDCPFFTVNVAVNSVVVNPGTTNMLLYNPEMKNTFQAGDIVKILSAGLHVPYNFTFAEMDDNGGEDYMLWRFQLGIKRESDAYAGTQYFKKFGSTLGIYTHFFNDYECFIDECYYPYQYLNEGKMRIVYNVYGGLPVEYMRVSMLNVPAGLDGEVIRIVPFLKIQHSSVME